MFTSTKPPTEEQAATLATAMPMLAGRPLVVPVFFKTRWKQGQLFTEEEDPDRTRQQWTPPGFILEKDPRQQSAETTVEELPIPSHHGHGFRGLSFARVIRHVLSEDDCASLLRAVNSKGFTPALLNIGGGRQKLASYVRDGHRIIVDSVEVADWLLEVLRPHLPEQLADGSRLVNLNERLRFLCYTPGQVFEEHCDGRYCRPHGHPQAGDVSRVTVQLYLHDVPQSNGGATRFFPAEEDSVAHQPEAGSVLLFTQDLSHEGSLLSEGLKYTLRTEAMYRHGAPPDVSANSTLALPIAAVGGS